MVKRRNKRARVVLKIDPSTEYLETMPVQDAIEAILKGKAYAAENVEDEFYYGPPDERGVRLAIPVPATIVLYRVVNKPPKKHDDVLASRRMILDRDNWTCAYCGEYGTTIDHIHPQSKGGENTWFNLITACVNCNNLKADMSLAEFTELTGAKLRWEPYVPDPNRFSREQELIWEKISAGVIDIPDEL